MSQPEGSITVVEGESELLPFPIARVFYAYDVVGGAERGGHAHKELQQFMLASLEFDEADYIRDRDAFVAYRQQLA
jgi:hypothetical protein